MLLWVIMVVEGMAVLSVADAVWPPTLPDRFLAGGFNMASANTALRTEMDTGVAKTRRRYSVSIFNVTGRIVVRENDTLTEMSTLMEFWDSTLGQGAKWFEWTHPANPNETKEFRFLKQPNYRFIDADQWSVDLSLEMR